MAKDNINGTKFRLIHLVLIFLGLFGSGVAAWVWQQAETKALAKETVNLRIKGCEPSGDNTLNIALMQKDIEIIQKSQADMREEQQEGFTEILNRLPK